MIDQIESFLRSARSDLKDLERVKLESDKKTKAIQVIESCLRVLDYTANNFPDGIKAIGKKDTYFPRPYFSESSGDYFKRVRNGYNGKRIVDFHAFVRQSFDVICRHKKCISHIDAKVKHESPPIISGSYYDHRLKYEIKVFGNQNSVLPVTMSDEGIKVGNLVHALKGSLFRITNSVIVNKSGIAIIDNLEYGMETIVGNAIVLKNGEKVSLEKWLEGCIDTCEEIFEVFKKIELTVHREVA